ncbi:MAG: FG-GAP-like repeat-containing protein [Planctomycetota bacterium]|nr:VCBS repeat-containing protein [Planctomycetaceae bacterium]MDQ3329663.1 FG-GAP-like repeat-containing protein [Planctomycetota bacterium]
MGLLATAAASIAGWFLFWQPSVRAERHLELARVQFEQGEFELAEGEAATALLIVPKDGEAALLAARAAEARHEYQKAIAYSKQIAAEDRQRRTEAALLRAKIYRDQLHQLYDAEVAYRDALAAMPENAEANTGLATLLALCGRWREAVPYAIQVVRSGAATDLVVLLAHENGTVSEPGALEAARSAQPSDPLPLVGLAWHAASDEHPVEAVRLLREAVTRKPELDAALAALGTQLLDANCQSELIGWYASLPDVAKRLPETWLVLARLAENRGERRGAIRAYLEASRVAPESRTAIAALARLLAVEGDREHAEQFSTRLDALQRLETAQNRVLHSNDFSSITPLLELSAAYEQVGRLWEAFGWCRMAVHVSAFDGPARTRLDSLRKQTEGLSLRLTIDAANIALSMDVSRYPIPQMRDSSKTDHRDDLALTAVSFRDDAQDVNLQFQYFNGTSGAPSKRMFEFTGGGIGVLDIDRDGFADVYFTQGQEWPPGGDQTAYGDQLYRNQDGKRFADASDAAGIAEDRFGQGVTVGDYDGDGFPDVYVGNIGANRLLRNQGDGTFADVTETANVAGQEWTTSCVLADLDGDGLGDIYAASYVTGDDVFERVCRDGTALRMCMPYDFVGQRDRLWTNNGDGTFADSASSLLADSPDGKGLGVAVWDASGNGRLSLLVANDTTPNNFYEPGASSAGSLRLSDDAVASGLALNVDGKATGSMGVALGDVDDDGRLDVFITNFLAEPNTFYSSSEPGFFDDRTREVRLHAPSIDVLGFGTQFLDADLDGRPELFVANGHIDDLRDTGRPYDMPAQIFRWSGHEFRQSPDTELGEYFQKRWLGRAVARIDWNRDGRDDLLVGHLYRDSALLTNTTASTGRFVQLSLTGTQSNRDAIGTTVTAIRNGVSKTFQLTAGDGYQASNERRITIGTGDDDRIDELVVRWPSGRKQSFADVPTSSFAQLVEGHRLLTSERASDAKPSE